MTFAVLPIGRLAGASRRTGLQSQRCMGFPPIGEKNIRRLPDLILGGVANRPVPWNDGRTAQQNR